MPFIDWTRHPEFEIIPGHFARWIHSERMTIVLWRILENAVLPRHSHEHEQISQLISGAYELTVDRDKYCLKPGEIVIIPSGVEHEGIASGACAILDTFCPIRNDFPVYT